MRIREVQTERFLMDAHGIFYELPMMTYGSHVWGIKPISYHLRIVPDFCFWRGMFVMAGDQSDHGVGQPQSGLLFQNIDDLWNYGKPQGWGSVWQNEEVLAGIPSDPFLINGFEKKILHLKNHTDKPVKIFLEVDILGNEQWNKYKTISLNADEYNSYIFPDAFSAQWIRLLSDVDTEITAHFIYN
jgi:hypothetical protein